MAWLRRVEMRAQIMPEDGGDRQLVEPGGSVRATTQASTVAAPASRSAVAAAATVAPVVMTSSTSANRLPLTSPVQANAPATLRARSDHASAACASPWRRRSSGAASGSPSVVATRRASSCAWLNPRARCRAGASGIAHTAWGLRSAAGGGQRRGDCRREFRAGVVGQRDAATVLQ